MNPSPAQRRPAAPALLSPIPFYQLAADRHLVRWKMLGLLLALLLAGGFFFLSWRLMHFEASLRGLLSYLAPPAVLLRLLELFGEQGGQWPDGAPPIHRRRGLKLVLYPSTGLLVASFLSVALLAVPLASALLYYSCCDTLENLVWPTLARVAMLSLALLAVLAVLESWDNGRRRWRQRAWQRQARSPAAHRRPERSASRLAGVYFAATPTHCLVQLILLLLGPWFLALLLEKGEWAVAGLMLLAGLLLGGDGFGLLERWGYHPGDDCFYRQYWWRGWQTAERWPVADAIGLLVDGEQKDKRQLWLLGPAGGEDRQLVEARDGLPALAEKLSAASGLPVLYRWPAPPAELFAPTPSA